MNVWLIVGLLALVLVVLGGGVFFVVREVVRALNDIVDSYDWYDSL